MSDRTLGFLLLAIALLLTVNGVGLLVRQPDAYKAAADRWEQIARVAIQVAQKCSGVRP